MLTLVIICCIIGLVILGDGVAVLIALAAVGILLFVVIVLVNKDLAKRGREIRKITHYKTRTYDDGFGKYTVDIKEEEYVVVPKDEDNDKK